MVPRILALDVGRARIGVAVSDLLGMTAQPVETIDRRRTAAKERIAALAGELSVARIVVGMPYRLDGRPGQATADMDRFIAALEPFVEVQILPWDERLTTASAERDMIAGGASRRRRRAKIDVTAAQLILQSYLDAGSPA